MERASPAAPAPERLRFHRHPRRGIKPPMKSYLQSHHGLTTLVRVPAPVSAVPNVPTMMRLLLLLLAAAAAAAPSRRALAADPASDDRLPSAAMREEVHFYQGDPARPAPLETTLFFPPGPGPFPLAVVNHGASDASSHNRGERHRFTVAAYYFLSRGYAVALPMMRGFARSGGELFHAGCDVGAVAAANARDLRAVIEAVAERPDVDRTRIVVAGQSFGGWNTLGLGAAPPPGGRALVVFNPAIRTSDCPGGLQDSSMAGAAARLGARTALPSLWFYGDNDSLMPPAVWRAVFNAYGGASPRAELVDIGPWGTDLHQFLSDPTSMARWVPRVDAFLARAGLPHAALFPQYLPYPAPPPSRFAALYDADAVPLGENGRAFYRGFLTAPKPRAFVIAPGGFANQASGGYDPLGRALRVCAQAHAGCQPYAVNDDVVWAGSRAEVLPPARTVGKTVRRDASTSLGTFFSVAPDCSSRGLVRVVVAAWPEHGSAVVGPREDHPAFPPGSPLALCNAAAVPGVGVTYTPAPGFTGTDSLTLEETALDGRRQVIRLTLTVL